MQDIRVCNIRSTHEGREEITIMMTITIKKAMMLMNTNKDDNDVEDSIVYPLFIEGGT